MAYSQQQQYYANLTRQIAAQYGIDPAIAEVQIYTESRFNPTAGSSAGAQGIAQFMPGTAAAYGLTNRHDPVASLNAYARHMRDLLRDHAGRYDLALAAYNWGANRTAIKSALASGQPITNYSIPAETRNYVTKILPFQGASAGGNVIPQNLSSLIPEGDGLLSGGIGIFLLALGVLLVVRKVL